MIKAATTTLIVLLLAGPAAPQALAQASAAQIAGEEAVRRQAQTIELRQTLEQAEQAKAKGDLSSAAQLYEKAWDLVQRIGTRIEAEREQTIRQRQGR